MAYAWLLAAFLMLLLWLIHFPLKNAAIVDVGWALGLVGVAAWYGWHGTGPELRRGLFVGLASLWGLRLAIYLLKNRVIGQTEEGRYQELRQTWKKGWPLKIFLLFQLQAVLDLIFGIPFLLGAFNPSVELHLLEYAGALVVLLGIGGESLADWQLKRFKADPKNKGQICQVGLWDYSRHPNYFFEWLVWVGFFLMALTAPYGYVAAVAPLTMLFFLFKVTGIPATEAHSLRSKGEAFRRYQETTSVFIPWFKKSLNR